MYINDFILLLSNEICCILCLPRDYNLIGRTPANTGNTGQIREYGNINGKIQKSKIESKGNISCRS